MAHKVCSRAVGWILRCREISYRIPLDSGAIQIAKADMQCNYFKEREARKALEAMKVREWHGYEANLMIECTEWEGFIRDS